jgi:hypothetical protein
VRAALAAAVLLTAGAGVARAQPLEITRYKHLGAATCASSQCHGKIAPQAGRPVGLNEYRTWLQDDAHSRAYRVLEEPLSKRIAARLGVGNPTAANVCLDCHADNVAKDKRGPKFQLSDGVGCEACHGGAERWVETHAAPGRSHKQNLADGMYPSEQPGERAELCLSCHAGSKDKLADHAMMAAGHPRLAFELEAYSTNQPAHFTVDADYVKRKGKIDGMNLWLTGQLESARAMLQLQRSEVFSSGGLFPELALYDCHSCHHGMDQPRWSPQRVGPGIRPGSLRLQTQNLAVLEAIIGRFDKAAGDQLATLRNTLVKAGQKDAEAVKSAAAALLDWLEARAPLARRSFSKAEVQDVRRLLIKYAEEEVGDYAVAEQIVLGVESLSFALGDRAAKKAALDRLYAAVKNGTTFNPTTFATAARAARF